MQSLDLSALKRLEDDWNRVLDQDKDARRELHVQLAKLAKGEVDAAINTSGLDDGRGKIKSWQIMHVGSHGGYAAVRAMGGKEGASTGKNSPGAITNYLENGHRVRPNEKVQTRKLNVSYVNGYHFYKSANAAVEAKALTLIQEFADDLAEKLGGG